MVDTHYYQTLRARVRRVVAFYNRLEVSGEENVPEEGGVLFCPRHENFTDPIFLAASVPRILHFLAWDGIDRMPLVGRLVRRLGNVHTLAQSFGVAKDKERARGVLGAMTELLRTGAACVVFPEGNINQWLGRGIPKSGLKPFRSGAVRIAARARVPIVPVVTRGTRWAMPNILNLHDFGGPDVNVWLPVPLPSKVRVHFGAPVAVDSAAAEDREAAERETQRLHDVMLGLMQQPGRA